MASRIRNMSTGRPLLLIISFALPLMLGNVFQQLYTIVDTAIVGKSLGVNALAALGAVDWLNWLVLGTIQGLTQGFSILMAKEFGAREYENLRDVIGCSAILSIFSSLILLTLSQTLALPVLRLLKTPDEIIMDSLLYLRIVFAGIPVVVAYNLLASILRALGDGKTPLLAMVVAALVNIFLDLLFVMVFHWGISGAAAATVIAQAVSAIFCLCHIFKLELLRMNREHFSLRRALSLRLVALSTPIAAQNALIAVGGIILQMVVNTYGVTFIAGFTASNKLFGLLEIAASSYGFAMVTYVGQNLGAGENARIRHGVRCAMGLAFATSLFIGVAMLAFGHYFIAMFISGPPQQAAHASKIAFEYLASMSICLPLLYFLHVLRSSIQGLGNTVLPMMSGIAELIMRISMVFILPVFMGHYGIYLAEVSAWAAAVFILASSYIYLIRKI